MPRVAAIIVNLVPYHHARWEACSVVAGSETHLVELTDRDEFKVLEFTDDAHFHRHTLFPKTEPMGASLERKMGEKLNEIRPDVVCVSGWGLEVSLAGMKWAVERSVPIVMLSESNEFDEARSPIKEWIKRRLVGLCASGLAGGTPQADYLVKLGLPRECVFTGYDIIDNNYFETSSKEARNSGFKFHVSDFAVSSPYFFACARFGKKKNLPGLIRAYARYRHKVERRASSVEGSDSSTSALSLQPSVFDLVIAGEGEERSLIEQTIRDCKVSDHVDLIGAKGYSELPAYYAHASAFIHPSTTEQWGLVVNEAMASGLPVLVSNRCGCATDLVKEGENGWTFDPTNEEEMADLMVRISSDEEQRKGMGSKSQEIIVNWGPVRFAKGIESAVKAALTTPRKKAGLLDRLILWAMTRNG
jgi:glycosyltransferase involved in cell wall biosynthesis